MQFGNCCFNATRASVNFKRSFNASLFTRGCNLKIPRTAGRDIECLRDLGLFSRCEHLKIRFLLSLSLLATVIPSRFVSSAKIFYEEYRFISILYRDGFCQVKHIFYVLAHISNAFFHKPRDAGWNIDFFCYTNKFHFISLLCQACISTNNTEKSNWYISNIR